MKNAAGVSEVLAGGVLLATIPIFSALLRDLGVSSFQQAFFRLSVSLSVLFVVILLFQGPKLLSLRRADLPFFLAYGFFLSMAYVTYLSSVSLGTPVGRAVFLTYTQPLFTIMFGRLFLGERVTRAKAAAAFLSLAGVALILQFWSIGFAGLFAGDVLAVLNGLFYSSFLITGRYIGAERGYGNAAATFWSFALGLAWLVPVWYLFGILVPDTSLAGFSLALPWQGWFFLLCLSILGTLLPFFLLNRGLKEVGASSAGVLLLVEAVVVVLLGALVLGESIGLWQIVGGAVILLSVAILKRGAKMTAG